MFADVFIHFILNNGLINEQQAKEALSKRISKVRPAVIAVYENLITEEQAKIITNLQVSEDMPFGFLAVREGYLINDQMRNLLGRQTKDDMMILQILSDKGFMSMEAVIDNLNRFKEYYNLTDEMYDNLVDNKVETYVYAIAGIAEENNIFGQYITVFLKTFVRCIDTSVRIGEAYETERIDSKYITYISCDGDRDLILGFSVGDESAVLGFSGRFMKQRMREFNEDTEDSMKEFMNMVSGLYSTTLEKDFNLDIDISVPILKKDASFTKDCTISAVDAYTSDGKLTMFFAE